ncbi:MAG: (2Fe-2S)-binding protein [Ectothiorhodospiraceae bacterium AqS1]|nr:(2Fe-2S)-binding protein [Ectothiorhodospiraceae bacterium AqS1]
MANFTLNDRAVDIDIDGSTPLLWVLRDSLELNGTKFGCGLAQCGACTVHLDGQAIRSCITPVSAIEGRSIKTIESIGEGKVGAAVQQAWIEHDVPQCGYCQSGQIMSAVALLSQNTAPDDSDIDRAMAGNICRCGTYARIRAAIKSAGRRLS